MSRTKVLVDKPQQSFKAVMAILNVIDAVTDKAITVRLVKDVFKAIESLGIDNLHFARQILERLELVGKGSVVKTPRIRRLIGSGLMDLVPWPIVQFYRDGEMLDKVIDAGLVSALPTCPDKPGYFVQLEDCKRSVWHWHPMSETNAVPRWEKTV